MKRILICIGAFAATPALAVEDCLVGSWAPDFAAMEQQFVEVAKADSASISGGMVMIIAADQTGSYQANDLNFVIENAGLPKTTVSMNGTGAFSVVADGGSFEFTMGAFDYAMVATIDMNGSPVTMDIPFSEEMAPMGGNTSGTYTCDATTVEYTITGENAQSDIVNRWYRQ